MSRHWRVVHMHFAARFTHEPKRTLPKTHAHTFIHTYGKHEKPGINVVQCWSIMASFWLRSFALILIGYISKLCVGNVWNVREGRFYFNKGIFEKSCLTFLWAIFHLARAEVARCHQSYQKKWWLQTQARNNMEIHLIQVLLCSRCKKVNSVTESQGLSGWRQSL